MAEVEGCRLSPTARVREQDAQVHLVSLVVAVEVAGAAIDGVVTTPIGEQDAQVSLAVISTVVAVAGATAVLALS